MAGFAIRSRFAGHPSCSDKTRNALRLKPDHPIGARQMHQQNATKFKGAPKVRNHAKRAIESVKSSQVNSEASVLNPLGTQVLALHMDLKYCSEALR